MKGIISTQPLDPHVLSFEKNWAATTELIPTTVELDSNPILLKLDITDFNHDFLV